MRGLVIASALLLGGCILDRSGTRVDPTTNDASMDAATADAAAGDAGGPPPLPDAAACPVGATRDVPCGDCGTQEERCDGARWMPIGGCVEMLLCAPGEPEVETEACGLCGTRQRTRTCMGCTGWGPWSAFSECMGEGVCTPGAMRDDRVACGSCGGTQPVRQTCNPGCGWDTTPLGDCEQVICRIPVFGGTACPGERAILPCPDEIGAQSCRCNSSGAWVDCESLRC